MPEPGAAAGVLGGHQRPGRRPALVVVDLSAGFTDPTSPLACEADAAVAATAELLARARRHGHPCVFTTIGYGPGDLEIAAPFLEKVPALRALTLDSPWVEIDERIRPRPVEPVLRKLYASAFSGVPLAPFLTARGCDTIVVCGASTSGCVRATAVDGLQHGFRVAVVRDAVADRAPGPAAAALFDIDAKYGSVVSLAQAHVLLGPLTGRGEA